MIKRKAVYFYSALVIFLLAITVLLLRGGNRVGNESSKLLGEWQSVETKENLKIRAGKKKNLLEIDRKGETIRTVFKGETKEGEQMFTSVDEDKWNSCYYFLTQEDDTMLVSTSVASGSQASDTKPLVFKRLN